MFAEHPTEIIWNEHQTMKFTKKKKKAEIISWKEYLKLQLEDRSLNYCNETKTEIPRK